MADPAAKAGGGPRVLLVSSEIHPLAKTGGLADVCAALPRALAKRGADVRLLMPAYDSALAQLGAAHVAADLGEMLGCEPVRLLQGHMPATGLPVWLLDCPPLYRRPGTPYQDAQGEDWPDNWLRFGLLAHAAARLALGNAGLEWRPDVLHCHDWPTGLAAYLVARVAGTRPHTLFTIHNAAFQGNFPLDCASRLALPQEVLTPDAMEFWGRLSFLKAGVRYADRISTVSPTYARELRTPEYGCGMEGLFEQRAGDFVGILNGIDTERWDPRTDACIAEHYSPDAPQGKAACKAELQRASLLAVDPEAPVMAFASRVTWQKMADLVLERMPRMLARHPRLQFALLGAGERKLERGFEGLAPQFTRRLGIHIGYAEREEHRLQAGADLLLPGARYEPCGLAHMIGMRYGALPVARRTGGIADTVEEAANGFLFDAPTGDDMEAAVERSLDTYARRPRTWAALRERAMRGEYGWDRAAHAYLELYAGAAAI
ncbi:MAG: glycogen synthase GlgA [Betaproteobacteria bacterium]|nr:glycogen synthase GlgA [Betaproteobacteria bacterium]